MDTENLSEEDKQVHSAKKGIKEMLDTFKDTYGRDATLEDVMNILMINTPLIEESLESIRNFFYRIAQLYNAVSPTKDVTYAEARRIYDRTFGYEIISKYSAFIDRIVKQREPIVPKNTENPNEKYLEERKKMPIFKRGKKEESKARILRHLEKKGKPSSKSSKKTDFSDKNDIDFDE